MRAWFMFVLFCLALIVLAFPVHCEAPIKVTVTPKVANTNPYKKVEFNFRWQIEPNKDNRLYAISYTCGSDAYSAQVSMDGENHPRTTERKVKLTVVSDCIFNACVVRVVKGKAVTYCDYQVVKTGG